MAVQAGNKTAGMMDFMSTFHMYESESLFSKKCSQYAEQVQDPQLKSICQELARNSSNKANQLSNALMQMGGGQYVSS